MVYLLITRGFVDRGKIMRLLASVFLVFAILAPGYVLAHPGGLNVNGGHRDKTTGEYHQHKKRATEGSSYRDGVIQVEVMRVIDGDTFVARFPGGEVEKVRLRHINTPERGEKGFTEATNRLKSRIGERTIEIKVGIHKKRGSYLRGHYGRVLADILGGPSPSGP